MKFLFFLRCFLSFVVITSSFVASSRIKIEKNGYEDIIVALPSVIPDQRTVLISSLKNLFQQSSAVLLNATKGRAKFHSISFLVPQEWGNIDAWFPNHDKTIVFEEPKAALSRDEADIIITNPDEEVLYPYALHHQGCGKPSRRIYVPSNFSIYGNLYKRSVELVRLWSEFRYGIFPEGGFDDDSRFPLTYRSPKGDIIQETGCINKPFRVPTECGVPWNCDGNHIIPSIMDQHYTNGSYFCEGHTSLGQIHNPEPPSKHNLLCNEDGTYYTVLRSPDFKYGKNAAPRRLNRREISFRYIKEPTSSNICIAVDISSQMQIQDRFKAVKNAFARFIYLDLPNGSNLSLFTFGGNENMTRVTSDRVMDDVVSRVRYLESQPLPEELSDYEDSCPECALRNILEYLKNNSNSAPHIVLITPKLYLNPMEYEILVEGLKQSEIRLHVFMLSNILSAHTDKQFTWSSLCKETGNNFVYLGNDYLGNLYRSFSNVVQATIKDAHISQEYLNIIDEEVLHYSIPVDDSVSKSLYVSLTGPLFDSGPLKYESTILVDPDNQRIYPQKQELIPAWIFNVSNPKKGAYSMQTWRKRRSTSPILITVNGQSMKKDNPVRARVWIETLETETKITHPPFLIFGEVRKGSYPVINATVKAYVYHPNNKDVSEVELLDDGLGNADITKHDGIYSRYYTNFTSVGFYTVLIKITGIDASAGILKGPSSPCCGSIFPSDQQTGIVEFAREAGPVTFEVTSVSKSDPYPPSKITDLNITRSYDNKLYILQWTAAGNDYDQGVASAYEIKIFRDRSLVKNRFFDSGLEVYNVTIETTEEASYGTQLYHTLTLTEPLEKGLYYIGIRAVDKAGNYGEPSNVVSIWLPSSTSSRFVDCAVAPVALPYNSAIRNCLSEAFIYLFVICFVNIVFW